MIIVSQDKKNIINFDNVNMILVNENKIFSFDNTYRNDGNGDWLGSYKTEERAKEVLQDIIYMYQKKNDDFYYEFIKKTTEKNYRGYKKQHIDKVYRMPEK